MIRSSGFVAGSDGASAPVAQQKALVSVSCAHVHGAVVVVIWPMRLNISDMITRNHQPHIRFPSVAQRVLCTLTVSAAAGQINDSGCLSLGRHSNHDYRENMLKLLCFLFFRVDSTIRNADIDEDAIDSESPWLAGGSYELKISKAGSIWFLGQNLVLLYRIAVVLNHRRC